VGHEGVKIFRRISIITQFTHYACTVWPRTTTLWQGSTWGGYFSSRPRPHPRGGGGAPRPQTFGILPMPIPFELDRPNSVSASFNMVGHDLYPSRVDLEHEHRQIFWDLLYMRPRGNQILHGDQTRRQKKFHWLDGHTPRSWPNFLWQMLTRDLFAVAKQNLVVRRAIRDYWLPVWRLLIKNGVPLV